MVKPNLMPISILWKKWHLWLQILLITLGIKQYSFGHSMGGYVALAMIEITLPKMTHICLINSNTSFR